MGKASSSLSTVEEATPDGGECRCLSCAATKRSPIGAKGSALLRHLNVMEQGLHNHLVHGEGSRLYKSVRTKPAIGSDVGPESVAGDPQVLCPPGPQDYPDSIPE